jgi:hypothetical protein
LSLFVLHDPLYRLFPSCLTLMLQMGVAKSTFPPRPFDNQTYLIPASILHYFFYWPTVCSWLVRICPEGACGGQVLWLGLLSCARVR